MSKFENLLDAAKLNELINKKEEKEGNVLVWVLAAVGAVVAIAGIAYLVYRYFSPDYLEDFEEDFDDDFEIDFEQELAEDYETTNA